MDLLRIIICNLLEALDALFRLDCMDNVAKESGEYKKLWSKALLRLAVS